MKQYKINEIFFSIQGEGFHTGIPMIFIRFSGCNMKCKWCDTDFKARYKYTAKEIYKEIKKYKCHTICFTGGEPLLQLDQGILEYFKKEKYEIHCETNGSIVPDNPYILLGIDWITVSPKNLKSWKLTGNEVKIINTNNCDALIREAQECENKFLQPLDEKDPRANRINYINTVNKIKELGNGWRLSIQTHKLIGVK